MEHHLWVEKYRPRKVEDCILPKHIKAQALNFITQGNIPHLLLTGTPGTGKTTLALAMCNELGADVLFINGSDEGRLIDTLRNKIREFAAAISFNGARRYVIIDEADFLNAESVQPALRSFMEEFAGNCGFILTCNFHTKILDALRSRMAVMEYTIPNDERKALMVAMLKRIRVMLKEENVTANDTILVDVIKKYWPDLRKTINVLQQSAIDGEITSFALGRHDDATFLPLWDALLAKDYSKVRTWITENQYVDSNKFYRTVFDWFHEIASDDCLPQLIVCTADYGYRNLSAVDPQVHLAAYCQEIMHNLQVKKK